MMSKQLILLTAIIAIMFSGCDENDVHSNSSAVQPMSISLKLIKEVGGFDIPECVVVDKSTGDIYVSNIVTAEEAYWTDDGNGFISLLSSDGQIKELEWLIGTPEIPIHTPKGMAICGGWLYFTDNASLKRVSLDGSKKVEIIPLDQTQQLNDLATDGTSLWLTDSGAGKAYHLDQQGTVQEIPAVENINGITPWKGRLFAVSWKLHEVYELDPSGKNTHKAFGLSDHFVNLDGIEVLDDGTFILSDFKGNQIVAVLPDRKTVIKLADAESAADIGIDRQRSRLYVPLFSKNKIRVYEICRDEK